MAVHVEESRKKAGTPVVMVHGAGGSSATWSMQLRGAHRLHLLALDLNGHGKTPDRHPTDVRESYLEDISSVVRRADRPVLVGHSMGGALAQLYALQHPEDIRGLVLVGTGARLRVAKAIFDMLDTDFESYVRAAATFMFAKGASQNTVEASLAEIRKCPVPIVRRDFVLCDEFDIMDWVNEISLPTLIIVGEEDVMTPVKYSKYLNDKISGSVLRVIPGAGHCVMLERPEEFNHTLEQWIEERLSQH